LVSAGVGGGRWREISGDFLQQDGVQERLMVEETFTPLPGAGEIGFVVRGDGWSDPALGSEAWAGSRHGGTAGTPYGVTTNMATGGVPARRGCDTTVGGTSVRNEANLEREDGYGWQREIGFVWHRGRWGGASSVMREASGVGGRNEPNFGGIGGNDGCRRIYWIDR
jgi:hypothetical protein